MYMSSNHRLRFPAATQDTSGGALAANHSVSQPRPALREDQLFAVLHQSLIPAFVHTIPMKVADSTTLKFRTESSIHAIETKTMHYKEQK